jgi:hypothetical protein
MLFMLAPTFADGARRPCGWGTCMYGPKYSNVWCVAGGKAHSDQETNVEHSQPQLTQPPQHVAATPASPAPCCILGFKMLGLVKLIPCAACMQGGLVELRYSQQHK